MSVPDREQAVRLLLALDPPPWFVRHAAAVAEIAAWLGRRATGVGRPVDRALVESAALLHDADKLLPPTDPAARLAHGEGSGAWLERHGFGELAPAVRAHPVTALADEATWTALRNAPPDVLLVAYADKRAGQRLEFMADRFASWMRRYPPGETSGGWDAATIRLVRGRAEALERRVCALLDIEPGAVRRLRWVGRALAAARDAA